MLKKNTCPICGSKSVERVDTYWTSDSEIEVDTHCENCDCCFVQKYHVKHCGTYVEE